MNETRDAGGVFSQNKVQQAVEVKGKGVVSWFRYPLNESSVSYGVGKGISQMLGRFRNRGASIGPGEGGVIEVTRDEYTTVQEIYDVLDGPVYV
jgi:hypothetical protein